MFSFLFGWNWRSGCNVIAENVQILGFDVGFGTWRFLRVLLQIGWGTLRSDWSIACVTVGGSRFWCVAACGGGEGVGVEGLRG